jgi:21S rRNA (GM2251-2'-O)-methyltransferase
VGWPRSPLFTGWKPKPHRTEAAAAAAGVVVSAKNSAPLSATVSKASAGAMEAMVIHAVSSMPRFLQGQAEAGWAVVGAAVADDAKDCASYQMVKPTVLVMGAPPLPLPSLGAECTERRR